MVINSREYLLKDEKLFGVPIFIALLRVADCVSAYVWRTNLKKHINELIAEDGKKI